MTAAAAEKDSFEGEDRVKRAEVFCFDHVAYAAFREKVVECMGTVEREEAVVKAGGWRLLLSGC